MTYKRIPSRFQQIPYKVKPIETEVMMTGRSHQILNVKIGDHTLNQVQPFSYIGGTVNEQRTQEEEIKNRIAKYSQNVRCMYANTDY